MGFNLASNYAFSRDALPILIESSVQRSTRIYIYIFVSPIYDRVFPNFKEQVINWSFTLKIGVLSHVYGVLVSAWRVQTKFLGLKSI